MQSGTANCPWAFQPQPQVEAFELGSRIGLSWSSNQDLVNQLRNLPMETIMLQQRGLMDMQVPRGFASFAWVPSVEPADSPEYRFLVDTPINMMNRGQILHMPFIIGYTSVESLFMIRETIIDDTVFSQFIANPHFYVPASYNLHPVFNAAEVNEVATTFRNMYLGGQHPSPELRFNWTLYNTDHHFHYFTDRAVRYHTRRQTQPIYYYKFSYDGAFNLMKRRLLLGDYEGAVHSDVSYFMNT
jgi:bile salt-stimulated lipase